MIKETYKMYTANLLLTVARPHPETKKNHLEPVYREPLNIDARNGKILTNGT